MPSTTLLFLIVALSIDQPEALSVNLDFRGNSLSELSECLSNADAIPGRNLLKKKLRFCCVGGSLCGRNLARYFQVSFVSEEDNNTFPAFRRPELFNPILCFFKRFHPRHVINDDRSS